MSKDLITAEKIGSCLSQIEKLANEDKQGHDRITTLLKGFREGQEVPSDEIMQRLDEIDCSDEIRAIVRVTLMMCDSIPTDVVSQEDINEMGQEVLDEMSGQLSNLPEGISLIGRVNNSSETMQFIVSDMLISPARFCLSDDYYYPAIPELPNDLTLHVDCGALRCILNNSSELSVEKRKGKIEIEEIK